MILGDFFTILESSGPEEESGPSGTLIKKYSFGLSLNKEHPVYLGHFPGNPVTPGVYQVRIIHELVSKVTGMRLRLISADNIKYLSIMIPSQHPKLSCNLSLKQGNNEEFNVSASILSGDTVFIKFRGIFIKDEF